MKLWQEEVRIPKEDSRVTVIECVPSLCLALTLAWIWWIWADEQLLGSKVRSLGRKGCLLKHRFLNPPNLINQNPWNMHVNEQGFWLQRGKKGPDVKGRPSGSFGFLQYRSFWLFLCLVKTAHEQEKAFSSAETETGKRIIKRNMNAKGANMPNQRGLGTGKSDGGCVPGVVPVPESAHNRVLFAA